MANLLDSDYLIHYLLGNISLQHARRLLDEGAAISTITYMEAYEGFVRSGRERQGFDEALAGIRILPFSVGVARRCASLRNTLRSSGQRVRPRALDLMIAATALHHNLRLLTGNEADYSDIPGLGVSQGN